MIYHVEDLTAPGVALCGEAMQVQPRGVGRSCADCTTVPAVLPRLPRRTDAAWCSCCGMTLPAHWAGCTERSAA